MFLRLSTFIILAVILCRMLLLLYSAVFFVQGYDTIVNMHALFPDARLVLILRDPIERAYSEFNMKVCPKLHEY